MSVRCPPNVMRRCHRSAERMTAPLLLSFLVLQWPYGECLLSTPSRLQQSCQTYIFKKLSCWNLNLSSIPGELNPSSTHLDASSNIITELRLINLTALQHLDISHNKIRFIHEEAFSNLVELRTLTLASNDLSHNAISNSKSFQSLHRLKTLDLSLNNLTETHIQLYLNNMLSLGHLNLSGNILTTLRPELFAKSQHLKIINMENNLISEIQDGTFESLKRLTELNLAGNNLATICDFKLHQLKVLNLSRNSLEFFLTRENENTYQLEVLDLSYNKLFFFPIVPKINNLQYLRLQHNYIGKLENKIAVIQEYFPYSELTNLEANDNDIHSNLQKTPLLELDLSDNQLLSFPLRMFSYLPSLMSLTLSSNCLTNISDTESENTDGQPRQVFTSLRSLDLQNNRIHYLSPAVFEALPNIEKLVLKKNYLNLCPTRSPLDPFENKSSDTMEYFPCVSFSGLRALKHLNLQENGIKRISPYTFQQTPLVSLNLDGNEITAVENYALDGLQNTLELLTIKKNKLTSLDLLPKCMTKLRKLSAAGNSLDVLPDTVICSPLKELDLRSNNFTHFTESAIKPVISHLNTIYISGNVFNCCSVEWLKLLTAANVKVPDLEQTVCFTVLNGSIHTELIGTQSKTCQIHGSTGVDKADLVNLMAIIVFSLVLIFFLLFFLKRFVLTKFSSFTFTNNKVASFECQNDIQSSV